jgi:hypothetical protein
MEGRGGHPKSLRPRSAKPFRKYPTRAGCGCLDHAGVIGPQFGSVKAFRKPGLSEQRQPVYDLVSGRPSAVPLGSLPFSDKVSMSTSGLSAILGPELTEKSPLQELLFKVEDSCANWQFDCVDQFSPSAALNEVRAQVALKIT